MLFLGTKKYPAENDYERYIYDSNGQLNGYTASTHSLYYFSGVNPEKFDGALDRFSRFFYEPLFNESCVDREMNAVDQEFRKNIEQDGWRIQHVKKELARQSHPFAMFNTGNLETMKLIDRSYLKDWFKQNYSADTMHFVLLSRDPIDILIEKAEKAFSPIPNSGTPPTLSASQTVFPPSVLGSLVWIEPLKDLRSLSLSWEIPYKFENLDTKPTSLISHALGHEGAGSLLSLLKKAELAEGLSAGKSHLGWDNLMFEISVALTEKGQREWREVAKRVFEGIASLKGSDYPKFLYDEINFLNKIGYQYQQRSVNVTTSYCEMLRKEGIESFPRRSYFIDRFDSESARSLLEILTPQTCYVTVVAQNPEMPLDRTEKWMGAKYGIRSIPEEIQNWTAVKPNGEIAYPQPNSFIPDDLKLITEQPGGPSDKVESKAPVRLIDTEAGMLYFHQDDECFVPEADYIFNFRTPAIRPGNARSLCLAELYLRFVSERLNELSYDASAAGLHYDVWTHQGTGIGISVDGYSQKAQVLLKSVLDRLKDPKPTEAEFNIFRESLSRGYKNVAKDPPLRQANERLSAILYQEFCPTAELAVAVDTIQYHDLVEFAAHVFDRRYIEAFVGGNVSEEDAHGAWEMVQGELAGAPCPREAVEKSGIISLPGHRPVCHKMEVQVKGNAVVWVASLGKKDFKLRSGQDILAKLMKEPFYSELRTKQQTGYIVSSGGFQLCKELFLQAGVQSNTHDARDLLARIELFLENFLRDLNESPDIQTRFESVKASILARLAQPHDTLSSKLRFLNYLAYEEDGAFDTIARRIEALEQYSLGDLREFAVNAVGRQNKRRMGVIACGSSEENKEFAYLNESVDGIKKLSAKL
ncbi:hypothetical protein HK104_000705 [Borealophlyctis nickersoniae]|nr:hypothetical protein HK104_000705 [Borealophlyctis nickersoniae]